jgi:cytochrome c-type biogenesis protein CcmH
MTTMPVAARRSSLEGLRAMVGARLLIALLLLASPLAAQTTRITITPEQAKEAEKAMSQLRSPVTPAHTVDMCPSTGALRDSIRLVAATGASAEAMVEDVIARHGEHLRILPKRSGAGLLAWLATPMLILVGGFLIFGRLRRNGADSGGEPMPNAEPAIDDADRARLAAALREIDREEGLEP